MAGSVKTIRTATRVLQVLEALNIEHPAGAAAVSRRLMMSRATTYRFLETLVEVGYLVKHSPSGHYSPSHRVRALSCGFEDEHWLAETAKPVIQSLGKALIWPIAIATPSGPGMLLRESTDMESPLAVNRFAPGRRISLGNTASGKVYLAFCSDDQRETMLDILSTAPGVDELTSASRVQLRKELEAVRRAGFATNRRARRVAQERAIAVPVMANGRVLAALSIRYADTAIRPALAAQKFLPRLKDAAAEIGRQFELSVSSRSR
jgi:IclR family transcriptional regulator, mhp operon transcriptional activator